MTRTLLAFAMVVVLLASGCLARNNPKIGILVHGCNTQAKDWEKIIFGEEDTGRLGRATLALAIVSMFQSICNGGHQDNDDDTLVVWGSGVESFVDNCLKEGQYTVAQLQNKLPWIRRVLLPFKSLDDEEFQRVTTTVLKVSTTEDTSFNTLTEIEGAFQTFKKKAMDMVILISSATHAPRCLRDASYILSEMGEDWSPILLVSPSPVCCERSNPSDVIVIEPPHLPERFENEHDLIRKRNDLLKKALERVKSSKLEAFSADFEKLLQLYTDL